ncbi:hypothetical protein ET445_09675 [Agromyces protaetiae]|uniref:Histidinol dehydrogenase n=1 Tax=Agromyces protaetiae TaxID=2509455 RepID=A0A4P6FSN8_9MICO|nr:hypothetical protein [Agromyces protaetiae]QAY73568.1 hypothetical protein ET445_09675 [Agromyces protaetiae]
MSGTLLEPTPRASNPLVVALVSFVVGAIYGSLGTVGHRHQLRFGEFVLPWGIVVALVGVAALLIGMRLLVSRLAAGAAGVGVIAVVGLFTLPGVGGSVLVPGTIVGTVWAVAPALIAVLIVAWPSLPARRRPASHDDSPPPAAA